MPPEQPSWRIVHRQTRLHRRKIQRDFLGSARLPTRLLSGAAGEGTAAPVSLSPRKAGWRGCCNVDQPRHSALCCACTAEVLLASPACLDSNLLVRIMFTDVARLSALTAGNVMVPHGPAPATCRVPARLSAALVLAGSWARRHRPQGLCRRRSCNGRARVLVRRPTDWATSAAAVSSAPAAACRSMCAASHLWRHGVDGGAQSVSFLEQPVATCHCYVLKQGL